MTALSKRQMRPNNISAKEGSLVNTVRMLSDITRKDIEKSYNISDTQGTRAYYSNRYGWTLKRDTE
jgi:hypothetical protein